MRQDSVNLFRSALSAFSLISETENKLRVTAEIEGKERGCGIGLNRMTDSQQIQGVSILLLTFKWSLREGKGNGAHN